MKKIRSNKIFYSAMVCLFVVSLTATAFGQGKGRGGGGGRGSGGGSNPGGPLSGIGVDRGLGNASGRSSGRSDDGLRNASDRSNGRSDANLERARLAGAVTGGPPPYDIRAKQAFAAALDRALTRLVRGI